VTVGFGQKYAKTVTVGVYRGVDAAAPFDEPTSGSATPGSSVTAGSLTPSWPGTRLVMIAGTTSAAGAWTAPGGMTSQTQQAVGTAAAFLADQPLTATSPTGSRTAGHASGYLVGVLLALRPAQSTSYGYDSRGNRTTATPSGAGAVSLGYDQANRLTSYGANATYRYNGDGLRTSKTVSGATTAFAWSQAEGLPLLLVDGTTNYVYGPGGLPLAQITAAGAVTYYHHDQLGSTRALTNSAGTVVATSTYDPYGKLTASTGTTTNPLKHAGQYTDPETGYQYLRARYYDPGTAVFLTRDPAVDLTRSPYGYVNGNPLNFTDPLGLWSWKKALGVVGAVTGVVGGGILLVGAVATLPVSATVVGGVLVGTSLLASTGQAVTACTDGSPSEECTQDAVLAGAGWLTAGTGVAAARLGSGVFPWFAGAMSSYFGAAASLGGLDSTNSRSDDPSQKDRVCDPSSMTTAPATLAR
jgi:RHS repeat-associated protein